MTPDAYTLALALCACEDVAPLPVRAGWAASLRHMEPHPADVGAAARKAHEAGHMHAGHLTPDAYTLALSALAAAHVPPLSESAPHGGGQAVKYE